MAVRWKDDDWFLIAQYLYQHDLITLDPEQSLKHIKLTHIRQAAKVIRDHNRRREDAFFNMTQTRATLADKIARFKTQLEGSSLRHAPEPKPIPPVAPPENMMLDIIASKVVQQLNEPLLHQLKLFMAQTMLDYGMLRPGVTVPEVLGIKATPVERKLKVGLVGLLPVQFNVFMDQFPAINFMFNDGSTPKRAVAAMQNCDVVITLTSKCRHGTDSMLLEALGDKYKRVHGGPTEMRRVLRLWIAEHGV